MSTSPFQMVLAGVDEDGRSDGAVLVALDLWARGASVELVHAVPIASPPGESPDPLRMAAGGATALADARRSVTDHLGRLLEQMGRDAAGLELLEVLAGQPAPVLIERARQRQADLLLLGPHRSGGPFDAGGTTRAVLAHATQPVWIQQGPPRAIGSVLLGLDASESAARALSVAARIAVASGARLRALHAFHGPELEAQVAGTATSAGGPADPAALLARREATAAVLRRRLAEEPALASAAVPVAVELELVEGEPSRALLRAARDADLLVVGTHGATALSPVLLGRVAERVIHGVAAELPGLPVVAVREEERAWLMRPGEVG